MTTLDDARRLHRVGKVLTAGTPAEPLAAWLECTQEKYRDQVQECADALAPHVGAVYFSVQYMSVLEKLIEWCNEHHPHLTVYGGFSSMDCWKDGDEFLPIEYILGWNKLQTRAMTVRSITGRPVCLVNNERRYRAFNEGKETIDYAALEQAIRESGVADCGVEVRWYMPKFYPEKAWTYHLADAYSRWFPESKLLAGYAGKPGNELQANYWARCSVTNQLWSADRIIHHIYVSAFDSAYYPPAEIPTRLRTLPGPKILWLEGANKPETARQTAAAFEAAGRGE